MGQLLQPLSTPSFPSIVVGPVSTRNELGEHVYSDEHHSIWTYGNVIVTYSVQPPNPRYLMAWALATDRLAARVAGPVTVMTIIDSRSRAPDESSKKSIREMVHRHRNTIDALVYVIEGSGFGAAALRSALSILSLTARYPFPQKVFASVEHAGRYLQQRAPGPSGARISVPAMIAVADRMRGDVLLSLANAG